MGWKQRVTSAAVAVAFTLVSGTVMAQTGAGGQASGTQATTSRSSSSDVQEFYKKAAIGNLAEVELGRLGVQKAQEPQVKQFAQKMVDGHSKALDELKQVAQSSNVTLPTTMDEKHQKIQKKLSALSGEEFDREYMKAMVDAHQEMENLLAQHAGGSAARGADPTTTTGGTSGTAGTGGVTPGVAGSGLSSEARGWASKALRNVRAHLEEAKGIEKRLKGGDDSR